MLGTDHITTTKAQYFIPEVWSPEVLRATENALVMAGLVKRFDSLVTAKGDVINIPSLSNLTANDKTAETAVTLQAPTETNLQILLNKHKEASFMVEDIAKVQATYDLLAEYTSKAGEAIARTVDSDLLAEYVNFTNPDVGTYGNDIDDPTILAAYEAINLANAPMEDRAFVIFPTQLSVIAGIDKFVKSDYLGQWQNPTPVQTGAKTRSLWGDIYGVPVYWTKQVPLTAGTPTQTHNIMFHKEAIGLALQQQPRVQSDYILEYLGNLVVTDVIYGTKTLRGDFGVEVRS